MKITDKFPEADFFQSLLSLPFASISYTAQKLLAENSGRNVIQCNDSYFDVHQFATAGHCGLALSPKLFNQMRHAWDPMHENKNGACLYPWARGTSIPHAENPIAEDWDSLSPKPLVAWYDVTWRPAADSAPSADSAALNNLDVVIITVATPDGCPQVLTFVLSNSYEIGSKFIIAVQKYVSQLQNRIWVLEQGQWTASTEMYKAVASVTFDNMVMTADKGAALKADLELFFKSKKLYEDFDLPWKRGYLLTGPPGNGKTHLVKALINHIISLYPDVAPLYVKSLVSRYGDHASISEAFNRARQRPCILVLEDLDTLINNKNRAVFLNELDGFHSNHGVVVVATTNHPEKLDPALRDRPSRFDRRYQFDLPDAAERSMYLNFWTRTAKHSDLGLTTADIDALSSDEVTGDFSYAYLKELLLSSAMQVVQHHYAESLDAGRCKEAGLASGPVGPEALKANGGTHSPLENQAANVNDSRQSATSAIQAAELSGRLPAVNGSEGQTSNINAVAVDNVEGVHEVAAPQGLSMFGKVVWGQAVELSKYIKSRAEETTKDKSAGLEEDNDW